MLLLDGAELGHVVGVYVGLLLGFGVPLLNDEQLVRVGGAQLVIVALKTVLLLDLCQDAGSGDLLQKNVPLAGEHTVGDQKHHVFHGEISLIMFQCMFF